MTTYREPTPRDRKTTLLLLAAAAVVAVTTGIWLLPRHGEFWLLLWTVTGVLIPMYFLVRWHARSTAYRCPSCGHEFEISAWTDFITPHVPGRKYVGCPSCGKKGWAKVLMKTEKGKAG